MVKCTGCGKLIDEPEDTPIDLRLPCPSCGSKARLFTTELKGEITFRKKLKLKARHGRVGEAKPFVELQTGDDFYRKTGEWSHREKIVDRDDDRYFEHIVNPKTGEVIHHCEERLSQHQGHGSAKRNDERERQGAEAVTKARPVGKLTDILQQLKPHVSKLTWWLVLLIGGAIITHPVNTFLNRGRDDAELARYYVASLPPHCKASSSIELDAQIQRFADATRRARAVGNGTPIWRNDCSIGAQFSIRFNEQIGLRENAKGN